MVVTGSEHCLLLFFFTTCTYNTPGLSWHVSGTLEITTGDFNCSEGTERVLNAVLQYYSSGQTPVFS